MWKCKESNTPQIILKIINLEKNKTRELTLSHIKIYFKVNTIKTALIGTRQIEQRNRQRPEEYINILLSSIKETIVF